MKKVIALGNKIMKDDGVGVYIAEYLKNDLIDKGLEVIIAETDVEYVLYKICEGDNLLIIDATCFGYRPGMVTFYEYNREKSKENLIYTQHDRNLLEVLFLYYKELRVFIIGIEVLEISFGFGLTSCINKQFKAICEEVLYYINKFWRDF